MTLPGNPRMRARLRLDAPDVYHLAPGAWYEVLADEASRDEGRILLKPRDALSGDAAGYIPLARSMVELSRSDGSRVLVDAGGIRWLATAVTIDDSESHAHWVRFVSESGTYAVVGCGMAALDLFSDDELLDLLADHRAALEDPARRRHLARPHGLRLEGRVKPAFAWAYRMLNEDVWYLIESRWTTEHAIVIVTVDGDRVVDAAHFDVRTFLD